MDLRFSRLVGELVFRGRRARIFLTGKGEGVRDDVHQRASTPF